jgi:hypothetical protein
LALSGVVLKNSVVQLKDCVSVLRDTQGFSRLTEEAHPSLDVLDCCCQEELFPHEPQSAQT